MEELEIEFSYKLDIPTELALNKMDICALFANTLDNAIEALRQSENKRLLLSMKLTRGIVRIDIENSYNPKQKKKADQKQHGIGLLSVSHTLEKYHGDLKHYVEDNNKYHTTDHVQWNRMKKSDVLKRPIFAFHTQKSYSSCHKSVLKVLFVLS